MVSTSNSPGGLFESIEKDADSKYHKIKLDYTVGLDKIYDRREIEKKKLEPEFPREYMGLYLGKVGNVFHPSQVDKAMIWGKQYKDIPTNHEVSHSLGIDPGFSTSRSPLVLVEHLEEFDKLRVIYSEELEGHPSHDQIVKEVWKICQDVPNTWLYIDGSARSLITELKLAFDEDPEYERAEDVSLHANRIIPVNFVTEHKGLFQHLYSLISSEYLCIPEEHEKVIISLKSAVANEYSLDKSQSSYNDTLDALRLAVKPFHFD